MFLVAVSTSQMGGLRTMEGRSIFFFTLSGICEGAAGLWTYYQALRLGGASLVVPIAATYPLITAILSWMILRETFTFSRLMGTALIVLGVWLGK